MKTLDYQLQKKIEDLLKSKIIEIKIPPQGMDSDVFLIKIEDNSEYAVKYSEDSVNDVLVLDLIVKNNLEIAVPKMFGHFTYAGKTALVLEKINFPLLESISDNDKSKYIPSMIQNLQEIHKLKSDQAGLLTSRNRKSSWKELLLEEYSGNHPWYNWKEISQRESLDRELILKSVEKVKKKIQNLDFIKHNYSLLHTDFNQRNLFVDPNSDKVTGIIDWSEARYGDPLYDFARLRMFIWHFDLGNETLKEYYSLLNFSEEDKEKEDLYLVSQILNYLTWYSETLDEFNLSRIRKHQSFLRDYKF